MKLIYLITLFFLFPITKYAHADIYTPISINLDHDEFSNVLNRYYKDGFKIESELHEIPKIKGLNAQFSAINYKANVIPNFKIEANGDLTILADVPLAYFELHKIDVKYKMVRRVGSALININTNIKCEFLKVSLKNQVDLELKGKLINGRPKILDLILPHNLDFQIEGSDCIGPEDFERFLPEIALEWLKSDDGNKEIINFLNEQIIKNFWADLKKGLEIDFIGRKIRLALIKLSNIKNKFNASLMIRWPINDKFYLNLKEPESDASLSIGSNDLQYVLKNWIADRCFDLAFQRDELPGVDKLFENRLFQFFIWPDLRNFHKQASFKLKIKICIDKLDLDSVVSNQINLNHNSNVFIQMDFINPALEELPYIFLWSKVSGKIKLTTSRSGLSFNLADSSVDFKFRFHPDMMKWRKSQPSRGPSLKTIMSFVLPDLEAMDVLVLENLNELFKLKRISYNASEYLDFKD